MVIFCIGSARRKREYFKKLPDAVVLDNTEVLFCASENGYNYFAYGAVPFAGFTVEEYLRYRRASEDAEVLRRLGLKPNKRLGGLCSAENRAVEYLARAGAGKCAHGAPIVVNLDGTAYSRRNVRALKRLLLCLADAYVCVSDNRFLRGLSAATPVMRFGKSGKAVRPKFYAARALAKRLEAYRISVM